MANSKFPVVDDIKRHLANVYDSPTIPLNEPLLDKLDLQFCGMCMPLFHLRVLHRYSKIYAQDNCVSILISYCGSQVM